METEYVWNIFLHHGSSRQLSVVAPLLASSRALRQEIAKFCQGQIVVSEAAILACKPRQRMQKSLDAFIQSLQEWCIHHARLLRSLDLCAPPSQHQRRQQRQRAVAVPCVGAIAPQIRPALAAITLAAAARGGLLLQELHTDTQLSAANLQQLPAASLTSLSFNWSRSVEGGWEDSLKGGQVAAVAAALAQLTGLRELDLRGDRCSGVVLPCLTALAQLRVLQVDAGHELEEAGLEQMQQLQLLVGR